MIIKNYFLIFIIMKFIKLLILKILDFFKPYLIYVYISSKGVMFFIIYYFIKINRNNLIFMSSKLT